MISCEKKLKRARVLVIVIAILVFVHFLVYNLLTNNDLEATANSAARYAKTAAEKSVERGYYFDYSSYSKKWIPQGRENDFAYYYDYYYNDYYDDNSDEATNSLIACTITDVLVIVLFFFLYIGLSGAEYGLNKMRIVSIVGCSIFGMALVVASAVLLYLQFGSSVKVLTNVILAAAWLSILSLSILSLFYLIFSGRYNGKAFRTLAIVSYITSFVLPILLLIILIPMALSGKPQAAVEITAIGQEQMIESAYNNADSPIDHWEYLLITLLVQATEYIFVFEAFRPSDRKLAKAKTRVARNEIEQYLNERE